MIGQRYPYTDQHELNLDWILNKIMELQHNFDEFEVVNTISFSGAWDITKQYPAWTIVDDGGMGYVSIKPVPAGVNINNGNYWRLIADYSVVVAGLASRITALELTVGDSSSGLVKDVDDLQADVAKLVVDDILIVFDSYGTTYGNPVGDNTTIPDTMQTLTTRNVRHFEVSGGGFVRDTGNGTFYGNLVTWISSETNLDQISEVIVAAGRNDWTASKADLKVAMKQFYDYCDANLPNLKKKTFAYIANGDNNALHGTKAEQLANYMNFKQCCAELNINWMPNVDCVMHNYDYMISDGVHPSSTGKVELAKALIAGIEDIFTWNDGFVTTVTLSPAAGYTLTPSSSIVEQSINNLTMVTPPQYILVTLPANISSALEVHDIASIDNGFIKYPYSTTELPFQIVYQYNNELFPVGGNVLLTADGNLRLNLYAPSGIRAHNVNQVILLGNGTATYSGAEV